MMLALMRVKRAVFAALLVATAGLTSAAQAPGPPGTPILFEGARLIAGDGNTPLENSAPHPDGLESAGIARMALPIGVNGIESVNCYVLADGDQRDARRLRGVAAGPAGRRARRAARPAWNASGTRCGTCPGSSSRTRTSTTTGWPAG